MDSDFKEAEPDFPKRIRFGQHVLAICLIIVVSWIIVVFTVSRRYDWSLWCGGNFIFNVFTCTAAVCAALGFTIYATTPTVRLSIAHGLSKIPSNWKRIIDSGNTSYFDPDFYKIVNGRYVRASNPNIGADHYGLPKVDENVPLNSFDRDIYKTYNNAEEQEFKSVVLDTNNAFTTLAKIPLIREKIDAYFSLIKEVTRIEVVGETCLIVRSWTGDYLLIHKSAYNPFIHDFFAGSGYKVYTNGLRRLGAKAMGMTSGLLGFLQSVFNSNSQPVYTKQMAVNARFYKPILRELQAIHRKGWGDVVVYAALFRFLNDGKNPLSYAYLEWVTAKHLMREELVGTEISIWNFHKLVNGLIKTPNLTMTDFYNAFGARGSVLNTQQILETIDTKRPELIKCRDLIPTVSYANNYGQFEESSKTFFTNFARLDDISLDAVSIDHLLPYLEEVAKVFKSRNTLDSIKNHNKTVGVMKRSWDKIKDAAKPSRVSHAKIVSQPVYIPKSKAATAKNSKTLRVSTISPESRKQIEKQIRAEEKTIQDVEKSKNVAISEKQKIEKYLDRLANEANKDKFGQEGIGLAAERNKYIEKLSLAAQAIRNMEDTVTAKEIGISKLKQKLHPLYVRNEGNSTRNTEAKVPDNNQTIFPTHPRLTDRSNITRNPQAEVHSDSDQNLILTEKTNGPDQGHVDGVSAVPDQTPSKEAVSSDDVQLGLPTNNKSDVVSPDDVHFDIGPRLTGNHDNKSNGPPVEQVSGLHGSRGKVILPPIVGESDLEQLAELNVISNNPLAAAAEDVLEWYMRNQKNKKLVTEAMQRQPRLMKVFEDRYIILNRLAESAQENLGSFRKMMENKPNLRRIILANNGKNW